MGEDAEIVKDFLLRITPRTPESLADALEAVDRLAASPYPADAVVIPRSAIPDKIEVALAIAADVLREVGEGDYDASASALSTLRRLLSGGIEPRGDEG